MGVKKTGQWDKVSRVIGGLNYHMEQARLKSLRRFALKAEAVAKTHMSKQDLDWTPLKARTQSRKAKLGQSNKILIATSTYFQSITSFVKDNTAYAGVKRTVKDKDGEEIANIAKIHEFGARSVNIVARPLWRPTFAETLAWHSKNNNPANYFKQTIKRVL